MDYGRQRFPVIVQCSTMAEPFRKSDISCTNPRGERMWPLQEVDADVGARSERELIAPRGAQAERRLVNHAPQQPATVAARHHRDRLEAERSADAYVKAFRALNFPRRGRTQHLAYAYRDQRGTRSVARTSRSGAIEWLDDSTMGEIIQFRESATYRSRATGRARGNSSCWRARLMRWRVSRGLCPAAR